MSNYTKSTNFATKDNLSPGDPLKIVRGTEIDTEFNNISTAISTKTDNSAAAITGGSISGITDLAVADGGTGASTATGALNNLLPSQSGNSSKYLQTDGTNATWDAISINTGDITGTLPVANGGTGVTSSTGTGNVVLSNSPTLVTPALGTPASGTLTNATGLPISTGVSGLGTGVATFLGTPSSANLASAVSDETGSGALVFANSPTLVTPALGTPSALVGTNITGTASGLTAGNVTTNANLTGAVTSVGNATSLGSFSSSNLAGALTDETGSGSAVFATSPTLVTPILGTPTSATLTNATGLPIATGVSGLGTGVATFLATPSSANLAAALTDETGSGANVFATSPTLVTPILGTPTSATLTNATGLPLTTGVTGTLPTANGGTNLGGATPFTSGGVVYASSSSALATGSALTFDGSGAFRLNSGASAPSFNLTTSTLTNGFSLGYLNGATDPNLYFLNRENGSLLFYTNNAEGMRLTSTGLGIGTSSPAYKLDVLSSGTANNAAYFASARIVGTNYALNSESALLFIESNSNMAIDTGGSVNFGGRGTTSSTASISYGHIAGRKENGTSGNFAGYLQFGTSDTASDITEKARIDSSGSLLVGTTSTFSAYTKGHFASGISMANNATDGGVLVGATTTGTELAYLSMGRNYNLASSGEIALATGGAKAILFGTNSAERARIDSSGNLLVGGTSQVGGNERFSVQQTGSTRAAVLRNDAGANWDTLLVWNAATSGDNLFQQFSTEATVNIRGAISYNRTGGLVVYGTTSDYRAKDISGPVTNSGALIDSVPVYMGTMKGATQERPMFIAHETPAYAHMGQKDAVDADGNPVYQQMDASALIPVMWAEIQSLRQRLSAANL